MTRYNKRINVYTHTYIHVLVYIYTYTLHGRLCVFSCYMVLINSVYEYVVYLLTTDMYITYYYNMYPRNLEFLLSIINNMSKMSS